MQIKTRHFKIESLENLADIRHFIKQSADALGADKDLTADLIVAANEATTNTYIHGFKKTPCKIEISVRYQEPTIHVLIVDNGPKFDPTLMEEPNVNAPLEARKPGGLGIHMIRELTDSFNYERNQNNQNVLTLQLGG